MFQPALALEYTHLLLLELKSEAQDDAATLIRQCLNQVYYALDGRFDPLACVRSLSMLLQGAPSSLHERMVWPQLVGFVSEAERGFALQGFAPDLNYPAFVASSNDWPFRHLERAVLLPDQWLEETPPNWFGEMQPPAPGTGGFSADAFPAFSSLGWARTRLQIYLQDLSALALSRVPQMGESWRSVQALEQRMSQLIDAMHTLPAELGYLEACAQLSPAPDPAMVAGLALALGTLQGRDGLAVSERYFAKWEGEPGFSEALLESWPLINNPVVDEVALCWLSHPRAERRALAVRLLVRRRAISAEQLEQAVNDSELVIAAALIPLVQSGSPRTRGVLEEVELRLARLSADVPGYQPLYQAFLVAAVLAGYPGAYHHAKEGCQKGRPDTGWLAGIAAERTDADQLLSWLRETPNVELVHAVGWAGDPASIPALIALLAHDDQALVFACAAALERITGAKLLDWFAIPAEGVMDDDVTLQPEPKLAQEVTDPRDPDPEGSPDYIELPSIDAVRWQEYVKAHAEQLVPGVRTRRGYQYTHMVSLYELDQVVGSRTERRILSYEIVVRSGAYFYFDERALVSTQVRALAELAVELQRFGTTPGAFSAPLNRVRLVQ